MKDFIQWTTPSPLWETAISQNTVGARRAELSRPTILRFATDSFMDDFMKMAETDPKKLNQYVALPETWRGVSPMPEAIKPVPAFARNLKRLGMISARKKAKTSGIVPVTNNKFIEYANRTTDKPLKLYQPAHQRFYMISACLVCERPGLPDKIPDSGREEKVTYVIRRLFPKDLLELGKPLPPLDSTWEEYAYIMTDQGARWKKAANKNSLVADEEQQPLFSVNILEDDGRRRKIFAGMIPTGRREAYMAASQASETTTNGAEEPNKPIDSRVYVMRSQFRDPWKNLLQTAAHARKAALAWKDSDSDADPQTALNDTIKTAREQIQTVSWLILLDFANYLEENLPNVWDTIRSSSNESKMNTEEKALYKLLGETKLETAFADDLKKYASYTKVSATLKDALIAIKPPGDAAEAAEIEKNLETVVDVYAQDKPHELYPGFLFPLADPGFDLVTKAENPNFLLKTTFDIVPVSITPSDFTKTSKNQADPPPNPKVTDGEDHVNRIAQLIEAALPPMPENQPLQMPPLASQTPMDMRQGWFIMRCVYERPLCGAIDPPVLSEPTKPFQIAGFFDPDAPARPIRIALPVDITPAGLRKFDRNTAFMMSDLLCGQVNRMKGITFMDLVLSVLPFPFHKGLDVPDSGGCKDGGLSIGMICSLSIPIITICALFLLLIFVLLLDFILKWMPFLMFCFPLPGLKAKDE